MIDPLEKEDSPPEAITFDRRGVLEGVRASIPIGIGVFAYGMVFGVLAGQAGLSLLESLLMSGMVFAGASQFTVLGLWAAPLPVIPIILTTLVVNLRHLLMGAALYNVFSRLSPLARYTSIFFLNDESWALTMTQFNRGGRNGAFLLGSGLTLFVAWTGSTLAGRTLGNALPDPARWGLDFAFTAVFLALLAGMWKGKSTVLPWLAAGGVALVSYFLLGGKWYILLGGMAGSLAGVWQDD